MNAHPFCRYDHIISRYASAKPKSDAVCAFAVQISLEKISMALASFQSVSQKTILKERKSYGYWSPRRCDVYVVSQQEGYLIDRLELTSMLWKNGISADLMYEFGLKDAEHENVVDQCSREGILYVSKFEIDEVMCSLTTIQVYCVSSTPNRQEGSTCLQSEECLERNRA